MDYLSFINSSAALSVYFREIVDYAFGYSGSDFEDARIWLRTRGLQMEESMFEATGGVNTQKGIVFLLGLSCFSAGYVFANEKSYSELVFRNVIKALAENLVADELKNGWNQNSSHGEKCFKQYGDMLAGGIRMEAEQAFPMVFDYALPLLRKQNVLLSNQLRQDVLETAYLDVLYLIVSVNQDTNILFRKGAEQLHELQQKAGAIVRASGTEKEALKADLHEFCLKENLSPGGSADLLALSLFLYFVENLN